MIENLSEEELKIAKAKGVNATQQLEAVVRKSHRNAYWKRDWDKMQLHLIATVEESATLESNEEVAVFRHDEVRSLPEWLKGEIKWMRARMEPWDFSYTIDDHVSHCLGTLTVSRPFLFKYVERFEIYLRRNKRQALFRRNPECVELDLVITAGESPEFDTGREDIAIYRFDEPSSLLDWLACEMQMYRKDMGRI